MGGISLAHVIILMIGVFLLIGAVATMRIFAQITGCVLRAGCAVIGLIMILAVVSNLIWGWFPNRLWNEQFRTIPEVPYQQPGGPPQTFPRKP